MSYKIGLIYQYSPLNSFGGGEKRLYEIFSRFNCNIDWYCQFLPNVQRVGNIRFIPLSFKKHRKRSVRETLLWIYNVMRIPIENYDLLVIGQMPFFHIPGLIHKLKKVKKKFIIEYWEYWGRHWDKFSFPINFLGRLVENYIIKNTEIFVTISSKSQERLESFIEGKRKVFLVPNGINISLIDRVEPKKYYDFIYFGRLERHKKVDRSIEVFKGLLRYNSKFKMAIIGSGSYEEALKNLVLKLKIEKSVDFLGNLDDYQMFSIIKGAKFFLFFSEQEGGSSISALESNACGVPVVHAFSPNGLSKDSFFGFLFPSYDARVISKFLANILKKEETYRLLRKKAKRFAFNFTWDRISDMYKSLIYEIIHEY